MLNNLKTVSQTQLWSKHDIFLAFYLAYIRIFAENLGQEYVDAKSRA